MHDRVSGYVDCRHGRMPDACHRGSTKSPYDDPFPLGQYIPPDHLSRHPPHRWSEFVVVQSISLENGALHSARKLRVIHPG